MTDPKQANEDRIKARINASAKRHSLPGAKKVYVKHCSELVDCTGRTPWGGTCLLIHPDITVKEFFN